MSLLNKHVHNRDYNLTIKSNFDHNKILTSEANTHLKIYRIRSQHMIGEPDTLSPN